MEDRKIKIGNGHLNAFYCTHHDQGALVLVSSSPETSKQKIEASREIPKWMPATCCGHGCGCDVSKWEFHGRLVCEIGPMLEDEPDIRFVNYRGYRGGWLLRYYDEMEFYDIHGDLVWEPFYHDVKAEALDVCIGLQDLELPALVTLEILDALFPKNGVRMWAKWELITAVKHFHQRR